MAELGEERSWGREEKGGGGKESGRVGVRGRRNGERLGKRSRIQRLFWGRTGLVERGFAGIEDLEDEEWIMFVDV